METVQRYLRARAESDAPAVKYGDRVWSWREYVAGAGARANALRPMLAADRPLHVGLLLDNTPEMVFGLAASALAGYVAAGINGTRRGQALADDILRADCQVLLTDAEHLPLLDGLDLPGVRVIDTGGEEWPRLLAARPGEVEEPREAEAMDTFMLIFTSGTSGAPKAVQVSNLMVVFSGASLCDRFTITEEDTCYLSMPMFHSNAILGGYSVALCSGAAMALAPRFSAGGFLADIRRYGATYMNYVGKPLAYILRTPERDDDADNPLRVAFGNEASDRDIEEFTRRFGATVWDGFGSTEAAIIITRESGTPAGSIGVPWDGVAVYNRMTREECPRAVFDANGRVTNLDEAVGELVNTQGAGYFNGYYNDANATTERLDGGMYWSGDLAYRDADGYVYLAGRTSDWLRVDGENLAAGMIENILLRHPGVSQAAAYGVPAPDAGDELVAALILHEGHALTPASFGEFLAAQADLSPKAWPRYVRIAEELPTTATNKVLKRRLIREGTAFDDPCWIRAERGRTYEVRTPVLP
ncbi:fatty-acid--CoA ligase FadD1 [Actinomadura sp. 21ATH]|uniref:fatty-acid--CoA ligase FadD1 n=1 Tax=Actinomadura sp. 21ATH TaxID=1735444 RepID=UPI0035C1AB7D